jgi:hypothetical protein
MSTATERQQFREVLAGLATKASTKIPALHGRVEKACKLVLGSDVALAEDGTGQVGSLTDPSRIYLVGHGACDCQDYDRAPEHLCAHRLSVGFLRKVQELLPPVPLSVETPAGIDPRHLVMIQGKPFVKFAGLLELAHKRGLQALRVEWTYNDAELSLAHAVAVFPFGTFEESGDATPDNVNRKVALHFRRCALTRAAARCLRLALGLDMVAVEELADE